MADPHQPALRLNCRTLPGLADTGSRAESDGHWPARGTPQVAGVACGPPDHRTAGWRAESDINKWLYYWLLSLAGVQERSGMSTLSCA